MDKRRVAYSLLLVAVAFVAALHTALALAFDTGLERLGALAFVLALAGLVLVHL